LIQQRHRTTSGAYLAGDLGATLAAFLTAWVLRFHIEVIPVTKSVPEIEPYLRLLPFILAIWPVVFYFHGLYQSRRGKSRVDEVLTVAVAVLLATVLLLVVIFLYRPPSPDGGYVTYSRAYLGLFALGDFLFVATARMILRSVLLRIRQSNNNLQRILVVGAGLLGREITQKLLAHRELGFEVVGFLDDDQGKVGSTVLGVPVLGTLRQAEEVVAVARSDQVFITLPL